MRITKGADIFVDAYVRSACGDPDTDTILVDLASGEVVTIHWTTCRRSTRRLLTRKEKATIDEAVAKIWADAKGDVQAANTAFLAYQDEMQRQMRSELKALFGREPED